MNMKIEPLIHELVSRFDEIPAERKLILDIIGNYLKQKTIARKNINLVYICTHNSRRSHFGQIAAAIAASYYKVDNLYSFSGGTEVSAFNSNAIKALQNLGFEINPINHDSKNPVYQIEINKTQSIKCFSKLYDDANNPKENFAAIMMCSEAEQNCPLIVGADIRIATSYKDPKEADNTLEVIKVYEDRFKQIATETLYAFSKLLT